MNLRSLRCFIAVAEELHFGRAARRLNLSQPPLTQHIKALEAELGASLFQRTKRSVRITDAGAALLDEARRLIAEADGLRHLVRRADEGGSSYLRAGFITSSVFTAARRIFARLSRGVPGITVMWQEMSSSEQIEALHKEKIDIAFLHVPDQHDGLTARLIVREPMVMAVPEAHRLSGRRSATLEQFAADDFVLPLRHMSPIFHDSIIAACREAGISPVIPPHEPRNLLTVLSLVSVGAGVSVVPATLAASGFPGVTFLAIRGTRLVSEVSALWKPDNRSPGLARALAALRFAGRRARA
ncbi:LysR substrate-binding domain-containing protein [Reyranella sp.]|uniref:LysR substrate-binding domain-containing protein n=1 Tax=Reyranella sp. TaxID=1929291 RepID=UPI003BAD26DC